ncbi:MAG: alkaline phosphatase family protein [Phycisphaerae bacterium]|nr:alkaline phosphatase family protein [Phycisphaerae bacterium]
MGKTVVVGLDGVPFGMLAGFAETGVMPNTAELIKSSYFNKMRSSIPEISSVAWSSIITGTNPGEHRIFGFIDTHPNTYKMRFPNYTDIKAVPFWDEAAGRSIIVNVPATYPVRQMNGVHVSGFVSIELEKSCYPAALSSLLKRMDYRLDVDASKAAESMDDFLADVDKTLKARIEAYRYLWKEVEWDNFMLVFTGTDRLLHFLWNAYADENHQYHEQFADHFRKIDVVIGEIAGSLGDDDTLVMMSDHGFEELQTEFYVNYLLMDKGLLKFNPGADANLTNIAYGSKAFALDPGRIFVNEKGKYPEGGVASEEREAVIEELIAVFSEVEANGKKAIKHIYRKEDVYSGPYVDEAADLILIAESGVNLKGTMAATQLTGKGVFTGKHTLDDAFLLVKGDVGELTGEPTVIDAGQFLKVCVK